jgi:hypothetical protein
MSTEPKLSSKPLSSNTSPKPSSNSRSSKSNSLAPPDPNGSSSGDGSRSPDSYAAASVITTRTYSSVWL